MTYRASMANSWIVPEFIRLNRPNVVEMTEIDRTDRRILGLLQADGRVATVELAERIGLSPTSTGERLKRLHREGYISGFRAQLDPHRLGLELLVFVEVSLDKTTPDVFEKFAAAVRRAPEVL